MANARPWDPLTVSQRSLTCAPHIHSTVMVFFTWIDPHRRDKWWWWCRRLNLCVDSVVFRFHRSLPLAVTPSRWTHRVRRISVGKYIRIGFIGHPKVLPFPSLLLAFPVDAAWLWAPAYLPLPLSLRLSAKWSASEILVDQDLRVNGGRGVDGACHRQQPAGGNDLQNG